VVEAIERAKAGGTSPNRFLRQLMGLENGVEAPALPVRTPVVDPVTIPGVTRGLPVENKASGGLTVRVMCQHCGKKFDAESRRETTCSGCEEKGHKGSRYDCEQCRLEA
jgi:hypothetical protein